MSVVAFKKQQWESKKWLEEQNWSRKDVSGSSSGSNKPVANMEAGDIEIILQTERGFLHSTVLKHITLRHLAIKIFNRKSKVFCQQKTYFSLKKIL